MLRAVVFDLGGTLLHYESASADLRELNTRGFAALYRYLSSNGRTDVPEAAFLDAIKSHVTTGWQAALAAELPPEVADWGNAEIGRLAGLCWQLQIRQGEQPFFLDSRTAGRLLGVRHTIAWRWLRGLVSAGVLELVRSGARGRANNYRYLKD